jgi:hypothetical protein
VKTRSSDAWPIKVHVLNGLPLFALVAFAGRCARRIQPAILQACANMSREHVAALEQAISLAELAASRLGNLPDDVNLVADSAIAHDEASSVAHAVRQSLSSVEQVREVAAAIVAANSAAYAADAVAAAHEGNREETAKATTACAEFAGAIFSPCPRRDVLINAMLDDLDLLKEEYARGTLVESTPVPPEFFGRLWHNDPPSGWPGLGW